MVIIVLGMRIGRFLYTPILPVMLEEGLFTFNSPLILDDMIARGALLGGRVWFDRGLNSNGNLQLGKLRVEFDAEEVPPLEDLSFGSRLNGAYFNRLAEDIQNKMTHTFGDTLIAYRKAARSDV